MSPCNGYHKYSFNHYQLCVHVCAIENIWLIFRSDSEFSKLIIFLNYDIKYKVNTHTYMHVVLSVISFCTIFPFNILQFYTCEHATYISLYKYIVFSMRIIALSWYNFLLMDKYSGIFLPKLFKYSNWVEEIAEWLWSFLHEHKALCLNHKDTCKKLGWFMKQPVDPKLHVSHRRRGGFYWLPDHL